MKLLIVDDSSAVYRRLLAMLGGVEQLTALSIARSLDEALDKIREYRPDAVVLDAHLPDGSGLDAIADIKNQCPSARVFVFSNQAECRSRALEAGADAFYDKSMEFELLVSRLLGEPLPGEFRSQRHEART